MILWGGIAITLKTFGKPMWKYTTVEIYVCVCINYSHTQRHTHIF